MLAVSANSPIRKLRELNTLSSCLTLRVVPPQYQRNELVLALLEDVDRRALRRSVFHSRGNVNKLTVAIADARRHMIASCGHAASLLADKAPYAEADGVKRWLLWIATTVAAANGNRRAGMGQMASEEAPSMLTQVATSLGISTVARAPTPAELELLLGLAPTCDSGVSTCPDGREYPHIMGD